MRMLILSNLMLVLSAVASHANDGAIPLPFLAATDLAATAKPAEGPAGEPAVQITGGTEKSTTTILVCSEPPLSSHRYVVRGKVKYEKVAGDGYLELWNDFGSRGKFFTRSLGPWGATRKLSGTSG